MALVLPFRDSCNPSAYIVEKALLLLLLAQLYLYNCFIGEVLVFLLFKGKLIKHANYRTRLGSKRLYIADPYLIGQVYRR